MHYSDLFLQEMDELLSRGIKLMSLILSPAKFQFTVKMFQNVSRVDFSTRHRDFFLSLEIYPRDQSKKEQCYIQVKAVYDWHHGMLLLNNHNGRNRFVTWPRLTTHALPNVSPTMTPYSIMHFETNKTWQQSCDHCKTLNGTLMMVSTHERWLALMDAVKIQNQQKHKMFWMSSVIYLGNQILLSVCIIFLVIQILA